MSKIFVRHRRHVGEGSGRPRFAIVAVQGTDLKVFKSRVRREEVDKIAEEIGAEVVYLPRGEYAGDDLPVQGSGGGRRHRRSRDKD
jgi:hypothetical protein